MLSSSSAKPPVNAGDSMPKPKTRSELLQAALKRKQLEVVPHKQMKNFMALKNKIINTDELIKRYQGKVAELESSKQSLKEARLQVDTVEQSIKGLRAELQALHEENEQLKAKLLQRDRELQEMKVTNHEDTLLIDQMTIQLKENVKIKEEYDLLCKTQNQTNHECEKWKKLYQKIKKQHDELKSSKGGRGRYQSLRVRRSSDICSLPPLNSPPYRTEMFSRDGDSKTISSPASVFSLPVQLTHPSSNGQFAVPVNETEFLEEKSVHRSNIASSASTKEGNNNDSCFSPPVENGRFSSNSSVELTNGSCEPNTTLWDDESVNDGATFSCDLLNSSTTNDNQMNSIEEEEVMCIENRAVSINSCFKKESTELKTQLFGEEDSDDDDDNLSVSDSSSCSSDSSLSSVDDLADLLSGNTNEPPTGKVVRLQTDFDKSLLSSEPMLTDRVDHVSHSGMDMMEVDLSEDVENDCQPFHDVKRPTAGSDVCELVARMDGEHGGRRTCKEKEVLEGMSVSCDAVVIAKETVISENHLIDESAQIEMDQQQLCTVSVSDNLSDSQQTLSPLPSSFDAEIVQHLNISEQSSDTLKENQVLILESQQLSDLTTQSESSSSPNAETTTQEAIILDSQQPTNILPHIEVAAADTASGEDSDEELDSSFRAPLQFNFETLSPIPPSPNNSCAHLYAPLSPIPLSPNNNHHHDHQLTLSPLPVTPLKSISPLPQSPCNRSQLVGSNSPINAHHRPSEQPSDASSAGSDANTRNPSPLQFAAIVPMGVQTPKPCCVEMNVAACGGSTSPTHSPTKSTPPAKRKLRLSDSSPFSPPCQSTGISRPPEPLCKDGGEPATCASPPKFVATPLVVSSHVECVPSSCVKEKVSTLSVSEDVDGFPSVGIPLSHSETPAVGLTEDSEIEEEDSIDHSQSLPAVSNSTVSVDKEVIDDSEKICPDQSAISADTLPPLVKDEIPSLPFSGSSLLSSNATSMVESAINLEQRRKETGNKEETPPDKKPIDEKVLLSPVQSLFEDGELPDDDDEQPLLTLGVSELEATGSNRKEFEELTVKPRDVMSGVKEEEMETQQRPIATCTEHELQSSSTNKISAVAKKVKKNSKCGGKTLNRNFTKSNSMTTSSFDELLSCFSSQGSHQSHSQTKQMKVNNVLDTRKLSPSKKKQLKKSLSATNSPSSLVHLRNAGLEARLPSSKAPKHNRPSCIDNIPTKKIKMEAKNETAPIPVLLLPDPSTDATPVHMLPGYQLRSREVEFWEKVPKNDRKRLLSGGSVDERSLPQKVRKFSNCSDETTKGVEMVVLDSNESGVPLHDDSDDLDSLQVVIDSDVEEMYEQTSARKTQFKSDPLVPPVSQATKSEASSGERSSVVGPRPPKHLVRQTDGATGQEEDQTPANSPKGFEDVPSKKSSVEVQQCKPLPSVASIGYGQPQLSSPTILKGGPNHPPQNGRSSPDDDVFSMPLPLVGNTSSSLAQLPNPTHMGGARPPTSVLSQGQQQLNVCMQCHLPLPEWLVSAMTNVQSMHQHCSASGKGVGKKKRCNMKTPIMKQPKQKTIDYIMLNLERMVCGHLHLSAMITMFANHRNVSNLPELVQAIMKFLLENYNPKTEHVVSLYHSLCDAVRTNSAVLNPYAGSFPPSLLRPECQLVALFAHLCRMSPPLAGVLTELNKALYQAILQPNLKFHKLAALIRLFTAICRLQGDKDRLLFLCFDLIKKPLQNHELTVIGGVASIWPLPLARRETGQLFINAKHLSCKSLEQQVLSYTLEVVVMRMFNSHKAKHDSFPKNLYTLCHWNSVGSIGQVNGLTEALVEILKTSKSIYIDAVPPDHTPWRRPCPSVLAYHVVQSLRLLSFQQGWVWTNDSLIRAHLWPLLQQWNKDRDSVREAAVACTVRLIGFVSKQGLANETGSQSIVQLQRMLKALLPKSGTTQLSTPNGTNKKIPLHIQLAAVDSLFELCPPSHPNAKSVMEGIRVWLQAHSSLPCGAVLMKEFEPQFREFSKHTMHCLES